MGEHGISRNRASRWLAALSGAPAPDSGAYGTALRVVDASLRGQAARYIALTPDPDNRFVRARHGEVGLEQGWALAQAVRDGMAADAGCADKRAIIAVIDTPGQAYGRREEAYGIHLALAAAVDAYASARLAGHPVIGLMVGQAMSGGLLAHGHQANRLLALDAAEVITQAMGKQAAAQVTLRSVEALEALAAELPPMAYDIRSYAGLGLLWRLLPVEAIDAPTAADIVRVRIALGEALADIRQAGDQGRRQGAGMAQRASRLVRQRLREQWEQGSW
ncbi:biotin-independent malonate decarboxylase subunit gamma [Chromobacterium haemolyticum]|uniref:Biotin-independent malonate decarboxylase subunit gamma n=1 Tax=Chromobacterium haemolyticum TaxID=394935 RepID=A0A1W0CZG0_9NEIS|nr:biotin-independent malonate decarboxylase subunit gamma [Chromobacterium haemolyticum]OQS40167.1 biotin-independent malonate decarboxylase subunit gamma [Chromobacterium haemolyticum]